MTAQNLKATRRYIVNMIVLLAIYFALLIVANVLDDRFDLPLWQRLSLGLSPVLPAVLMIFVFVDHVRTFDEVWRNIFAEATFISAGVVGIGSFTLGFLEGVIELPDDLLIWIFPAMIGIQGIAIPFVRLRYR